MVVETVISRELLVKLMKDVFAKTEPSTSTMTAFVKVFSWMEHVNRISVIELKTKKMDSAGAVLQEGGQLTQWDHMANVVVSIQFKEGTIMSENIMESFIALMSTMPALYTETETILAKTTVFATQM